LNPATAGQEIWAAASRDTSTTVFSLDLALNLQRAVLQKSGKMFTDVWTSYKQQQNFYALLQNQVRFAGELKMGAGEVSAVTWNNMQVSAFPDILDADWYSLTLDDFQYVHGAYKSLVWASDLEGSSQGMVWNLNSTNFADAVFLAYNVGVNRRNTQAGATALTA